MVDSTLNFDVSALVDNRIEAGTNTDTELYLKFTGAKVKLNSIDELVKVIEIINNRLGTLDDPELIRIWIHKVIKTSPIVDERTKDLLYFKPVSEEIGSTYLLHTQDTQTLALQDWITNKPTPIRGTLKEKLDNTTYNQVTSAYHELNIAMNNNISTEYFYERSKGQTIEDALRDQDKNYLGKVLYSNDFHIAGDYTFKLITIDAIKDLLLESLIKFMGGSERLINWLYPVNTIEESIQKDIKITLEGNEVLVNLKGDKSGVIATVIDETSIIPIGCN